MGGAGGYHPDAAAVQKVGGWWCGVLCMTVASRACICLFVVVVVVVVVVKVEGEGVVVVGWVGRGRASVGEIGVTMRRGAGQAVRGRDRRRTASGD